MVGYRVIVECIVNLLDGSLMLAAEAGLISASLSYTPFIVANVPDIISELAVARVVAFNVSRLIS